MTRAGRDHMGATLPSSEHIKERLQLLALQSAQHTLQAAAQFADMHAPAKLLFQKQMRRPGGGVVAVQMVWPGVLRVFNPKTGELLAESEPGQPQTLRSDFWVNNLSDVRPL